MLIDNNLYSTLTPAELKTRALIGQSGINIILFISLISSMGYWYALGIENSNSTGFWSILGLTLIGLGLASEFLKKLTLSLFRNKTIWIASTIVSVLTVMGTLSIIDNNREQGLIKSSDSYKTAQARQENSLDNASKWAWASGFNLDSLNKEIINITAKRERREIGYQAYLAQKRAVKEKIQAKQNYQSSLNMQTMAGAIMSQSSNTATSSNPLLSEVALLSGLTAIFVKMAFYLAVTLLLEFGAWFLGGEVEKINNQLKLTKEQLLDLQNKAVFGFSFAEIKQQKLQTALPPADLDSVYILYINGQKKAEKKMLSAQVFIDSILKYLAQNDLISKYENIEIKAVNKANKSDFVIHKVNRPTLNNQDKIEPLNPEPKQVQKTPEPEPKQVQKIEVQDEPKTVTKGRGAGSTGSKRAGSTPDTGTTGDTSHRYNSVKKAILNGDIKGTIRAIKSFKIDGVGAGDKTAQNFRKALIKDGIIKG